MAKERIFDHDQACSYSQSATKPRKSALRLLLRITMWCVCARTDETNSAEAEPSSALVVPCKPRINLMMDYVVKGLEPSPGIIIVDVGAGTGDFSIYASALGWITHAVEAKSENIAVIEHNIFTNSPRSEKIVLHNVAFVCRGTVSSSNSFGDVHNSQDDPSCGNLSEVGYATSLDSIIPVAKGVGFMRVDTSGSEYLVLEGAGRILVDQTPCGIAIEMPRSKQDVGDVIAILLAKGYEARHLDGDILTERMIQSAELSIMDEWIDILWLPVSSPAHCHKSGAESALRTDKRFALALAISGTFRTFNMVSDSILEYVVEPAIRRNQIVHIFAAVGLEDDTSCGNDCNSSVPRLTENQMAEFLRGFNTSSGGRLRSFTTFVDEWIELPSKLTQHRSTGMAHQGFLQQLRCWERVFHLVTTDEDATGRSYSMVASLRTDMLWVRECPDPAGFPRHVPTFPTAYTTVGALGGCADDKILFLPRQLAPGFFSALTFYKDNPGPWVSIRGVVTESLLTACGLSVTRHGSRGATRLAWECGEQRGTGLPPFHHVELAAVTWRQRGCIENPARDAWTGPSDLCPPGATGWAFSRSVHLCSPQLDVHMCCPDDVHCSVELPPVSVQRPRMDIMCRTFHDAMFEIMRMILTYLIFFPANELSSQVILVLDAENELDRIVGSVLETAYQSINVKVFFEEPPPPGTLTARVRYEGYSRSQWSNFYSDLYSDADFIAIIDSDTEFSFRPDTSKHFLLNWTKPVMHGIYDEKLISFDCVKFMIGKDAVGEFMYVFPFVVKREHFAAMRQHITRHTGHQTFEQAWFDMQNRFERWGQFLVMGNYLYHFHRDEYAWQVVHGNVSTVDRPYPYIANHQPMDQNVRLTARKYHGQMCVQSRGVVAGCNSMTEEEIDMAKFVSFTDYWPMPNGVSGYDMQLAKTHDSAAPRIYGEVFDEIVDEIYREGWHWSLASHDWTDRTKRPA